MGFNVKKDGDNFKLRKSGNGFKVKNTEGSSPAAESGPSWSTETLSEDGPEVVIFDDGIIEWGFLPHGGAKDGHWVISGSIYTTDGINWATVDNYLSRENYIGPNVGPWNRAGFMSARTYLLKGVYSDGQPSYFDCKGYMVSFDMTNWWSAAVTAWPLAQADAEIFFWKNQWRGTTTDNELSNGIPKNFIFDRENECWRGGNIWTNDLPYIEYVGDDAILNADVLRYGDSKPDGTEVIMLARDTEDENLNTFQGGWTPVYVKDNLSLGNGPDSIEPLAALSAYAGMPDPNGTQPTIRAIRYNERDNYWLALTNSVSLKSQPGDIQAAWTEVALPETKFWAPICWDGTKWITVSQEPGDQIAIYSYDGINWITTNDIAPSWEYDEYGTSSSALQTYAMGTNGKTLFGFRTIDTTETTGRYIQYRMTPPA